MLIVSFPPRYIKAARGSKLGKAEEWRPVCPNDVEINRGSTGYEN